MRQYFHAENIDEFNYGHKIKSVKYYIEDQKKFQS